MNLPRRPPILDYAIARNCTRWLGDHNCGKEAIRHVIWDEDLENGFVCDEHLGELGTVWTFFAAHEVGPDCAMPGALFFIEENVCRCPDELVAAEEVEFVDAVALAPVYGGMRSIHHPDSLLSDRLPVVGSDKT